jgi:hypothetical protein
MLGVFHPSWIVVACESHGDLLIIKLLISLGRSCSTIFFFWTRENEVVLFLSPRSCRLSQVEQVLATHDALDALVHKFRLVLLVSALSLAEEELLLLLRWVLKSREVCLTIGSHCSIHGRLRMTSDITELE